MLSSFGARISLLWFLLANPLLISSQQTTPTVLDTAGQPIRSNTRYYILPVGTKNGGGAAFVNFNGSCPSFVGLGNHVGSLGLPVTFTPSSGEITVRESSNFLIKFNVTTTCVESTEWALEGWPAPTGRTLFETTARSTVAAYLKIERNGKQYKLVWCPSNLCPTCGDVGVYVENKIKLLGLYVSALPVVFRRA
ncbi:hypothetical protein ACHQM5_024318 [Ranunculus cassubicifolius]